jgi:hypothetical protein
LCLTASIGSFSGDTAIGGFGLADLRDHEQDIFDFVIRCQSRKFSAAFCKILYGVRMIAANRTELLYAPFNLVIGGSLVGFCELFARIEDIGDPGEGKSQYQFFLKARHIRHEGES